MDRLTLLSESIVHTEWSLPVVLKNRDTWLYMITSKRSQNTENVLYKTLCQNLREKNTVWETETAFETVNFEFRCL